MRLVGPSISNTSPDPRSVASLCFPPTFPAALLSCPSSSQVRGPRVESCDLFSFPSTLVFLISSNQ